MTLRKKNCDVRIVKREYNSTEWVMMMRNQEIDKRRKFSQPNSYQMMCSLDFFIVSTFLLSSFPPFSSIRSPRTHFQFHILSVQRKIEM